MAGSRNFSSPCCEYYTGNTTASPKTLRGTARHMSRGLAACARPDSHLAASILPQAKGTLLLAFLSLDLRLQVLNLLLLSLLHALLRELRGL